MKLRDTIEVHDSKHFLSCVPLLFLSDAVWLAIIDDLSLPVLYRTENRVCLIPREACLILVQSPSSSPLCPLKLASRLLAVSSPPPHTNDDSDPLPILM